MTLLLKPMYHLPRIITPTTTQTVVHTKSELILCFTPNWSYNQTVC